MNSIVFPLPEILGAGKLPVTILFQVPGMFPILFPLPGNSGGGTFPPGTYI